MKEGGEPPSFEGLLMNKEIAQLRIFSLDDEKFREVEMAIDAFVVGGSFRVDRGFGFIRLSSTNLTEVEHAYEQFKDAKGVGVVFSAAHYIAPRDTVTQNGYAVEAAEELCCADLWLEVSPSGSDECLVEFGPIDADTDVLERTINRLFSTSPGLTAPVVACRVAFVSYAQTGAPSRATVENAVLYAFESALGKAKPKTMEPVMSVTVAVKEAALPDMIAFINRQRGMIEELDETGELKIVKSTIPLDEIIQGKATFEKLTEGGRFEHTFKNFVVRPENVKI